MIKVLIIGLDGANWSVLDDALVAGHMPTLRTLRTEGNSGVLQSTHPPVTAAAWTTCITGCQPYTHGVVGFKDYSFRDDRLRISSAASCRVPNMFQQLSSQGFKVASINVPWTYPCADVNGIVVSGYGTPDTTAAFTSPPEFKKELLAAIPDFDFIAPWQKGDNRDLELFDSNISKVERCFAQRVETAKMVNGKISPDLMMVQFQDLDLMQHHIWPCLSSQTRDSYPVHRDRLFRMFEKLDSAIAELLELAGSDTTVIVMSDHGFGPMHGSIRANMFLHDWGYLRTKSSLGRMVRRARRNLISEKDEMEVELKTPVDWKNSKAMVMYSAVNGHIYLNVKGRNPHGTVERGAEFDAIIEDLKGKFAQITNPKTPQKVFQDILTPAELYGVPSVDTEILGDLILIPAPGYIVHQSTSRKGPPIRLEPPDTFTGCHYYEGIYVVKGPGVDKTAGQRAHIVDIAPTVYALMDAELPAYVDGKPAQSLFERKLEAPIQAPTEKETAKPARENLSDAEQELVRKRLAELGYMD